MKFTFLKLKKKSLPTLKSLQPHAFDVDMFWFATLGFCLVIISVTALVGFNFFYSQYFESYKKSDSTKVENILNIEKLKATLNKRNVFINKQISSPKDPSF